MDDENIIVCRCEDLTLKDLKKLLVRGYTTFDEIKRLSRAGMGPCQGKTCKLIILQEIAKFLKKDIQNLPLRRTHTRPPGRPIYFKELIGEEDEK